MNTHTLKPTILLSGTMKRRTEEMEQMEVEGAPSTSQDRECDICHGKFKGDHGLRIHMAKKHNKRRRNAVVTPNDIAHPDTAASIATEATIEADSPQAQTPSRNIEWVGYERHAGD